MMWRENWRRKTTAPGHQHNARMFPNSPMRTLNNVFARRGVSPTSQIRAELQMKSGHSFWAKHREASDTFDLHGLFDDYWSSDDHQFTVLGQSLSPMSLRMSDREAQTLLSLESIVALYNYNSPQMLRFVPLPLPSPSAKNVRIGGSSTRVAP